MYFQAPPGFATHHLSLEVICSLASVSSLPFVFLVILPNECTPPFSSLLLLQTRYSRGVLAVVLLLLCVPMDAKFLVRVDPYMLIPMVDWGTLLWLSDLSPLLFPPNLRLEPLLPR